MKENKIVWTLLPNGMTESGQLKLSLFCAPQLKTDEGLPRPTLHQFKELWEDWPAIARKLKVKVKFFPSGEGDSEFDPDMPEPNSDIWKQLFTPSTYVNPFKFNDLTNRNIYSYPVGNVLSFLRGMYGNTAATSPTEFPSKGDLWGGEKQGRNGGLASIAFYNFRNTDNIRGAAFQDTNHKDLVAAMSGRYELGNKGYKKNAVPPGPPNTKMDFYQLSYFHQPHSEPLPDKHYTNKFGKSGMISGGYRRIGEAQLKKPDGVHDQTDLDFHAVLSSLASYPRLMRHLGLVLDLVVPVPAGFVETSASSGLPAVQAVVTFPAGVMPPIEVRSKTVYHAGGKRFISKPRFTQPDLDEFGLLRLRDKLSKDQDLYNIVQVDVDGGGMKLMNTAYSLVQSEVHRTVDSATDSSLPSLRSAGFSIARAGNALRLAQNFQDQHDFSTSGSSEPVLYAEDVLRGYRMDVRDSRTKEWHSLYWRHGIYDFNLGKPLEFDDEGFTQLATRQAADGYTNDLFLHESFVRWEGWSLVVPRPGNAMDNAGISQKPSDLNPTNPNYSNFKPSFRLPYGDTPSDAPKKPASKLPGLRFGLSYELRIRGVDLAGNSTPAKDLPIHDPLGVTESEMYTRFEPVSSPTLVLHEDLAKYQPPAGGSTIVSPGESLERIVIRTYNDGIDPSTDTKVTHDTAEHSSRHLAPPKVGIMLTDHHGKFDFKPADWNTLSPAQRQQAMTNQYGKIQPLADGAFAQTKVITSAPFPPPSGPEPPAPASSPGAVYPIFKNDILDKMPYLPDPIASGVSFLNVPGLGPDMMVHYPPSGAIPNSLLPAVQKENLVMVDYQKGDMWYGLKGFRIELRDATEAGASIPGHAVPPKWDDGGRVLTLFLNKSDVFELPYSSLIEPAPLELGENPADPTKTAIDAMGMWQWIKSLNLPPAMMGKLRKFVEQGRHWMFTPSRKIILVHAVQKPLLIPQFADSGATKFGALKAYMGDTFATLLGTLAIHGKSTGKIDIQADWMEPVDDLRDPTWKTVSGGAHVCEIKVEDPTTNSIVLNNAHNFGDTKHRWVNYNAVASTRFREYFPADITKDESKISVRLDAKKEPQLNILSSARPAKPDLLYIVPIFGWEPEKSSPKGVAHKRRGNGLRIYMNRPWYSSGADERLGVMIWTGSFSDLQPGQSAAKYQPYVSEWGMDPIWASGAPTGGASLNSFPRHKEYQSDVTLDELTVNSLKLINVMKVQNFPTIGAGSTPPSGGTTGGALGQFVNANMAVKKVPSPPKRGLQNLTAYQPKTNVLTKLPEYNITIPTFLKPTLMVVGHEVQFDPERQLWFCDIEIDAGPTYTPFVRLALTRFQPYSLPDAFVSRVVIADFAQLVPDRNVAVFFDPANPKLIVVAVSGPTYTNKDEKGRAGGVFEVSLEMARPDISDKDEELRWAPIPDSTYEMQSRVNKDGTAAWTALITLPEPRGSRSYRLVLKEFERFGEDASSGMTFMMAKQQVIDPNRRRIVFADTVEI